VERDERQLRAAVDRLEGARSELDAAAARMLAQEQRLYDLEGALAALFAETDDVVIALNADLTVEGVSRGADRLAGVGPEKMLGRSLATLSRTTSLGSVVAAAEAALRVAIEDGRGRAVESTDTWDVRAVRAAAPARVWLVIARPLL
jgi:PAS domain-containing protein